jgi:hypothetical protein
MNRHFAMAANVHRGVGPRSSSEGYLVACEVFPKR